jgi:hypothetical protein
MSATKTYPFLLCALAVLAARDSVRADAVTLDAERQAICEGEEGSNFDQLRSPILRLR